MPRRAQRTPSTPRPPRPTRPPRPAAAPRRARAEPEGGHRLGTETRIPNRVRVARVEKGWTQQELADRVGVTRQTIGLIEKGQYNPTIALCLRLAEVLGKTLDDLFMPQREESR